MYASNHLILSIRDHQTTDKKPASRLCNVRSLLGVMVSVMTMLFIPKYKLPEQPADTSFIGYFSLLQSKPLMLLMASLVFMFMPYWIKECRKWIAYSPNI
jgi:hypothetical protein